MPTKNTNISDKLQAAIKRDPQKATVLGVLLVILGVVVVRYLVPGSTLPQRAQAVEMSSDTKTEIVEGAKQRARSLSAEDELEKFLVAPAPAVDRNLFALKLDYFPSDGTKSPQNTGTRSEEKNDDPIAKSLKEQADQQSRKEVLIANLRQQASQLNLQSILMGSTPRAVINGELLGEGDVVASFRVLRIEARRIIVEREGIRLEITMK